jgi:PBP superfamily domain
MRTILLALLAGMIAGCAPVATPTATPVTRVSASSAAQPWLSEMYQCAEKQGLVLAVDNPGDAEVTLRLGESPDLSAPAFQIDEDEILAVVQPQTGVSNLTLDQVRAIYTGQISNWSQVGGSSLPIELWMYAEGEDIQQIFDQTVLNGLKIIPSARLAVSAQSMSDNVGKDAGAIGFLPRRWKAGNTHETLIIAKTPVLAITTSEPKDRLAQVLSCLQK